MRKHNSKSKSNLSVLKDDLQKYTEQQKSAQLKLEAAIKDIQSNLGKVLITPVKDLTLEQLRSSLLEQIQPLLDSKLKDDIDQLKDYFDAQK